MDVTRGIWRGALAAAVLTASVPGLAGESEDFAGCDGLRKPKSKDDGMRGTASQPAYSFGRGAGPESVIAACTRALAGGKLLPTQTLRQAHLLRARAAAKLKLGAVEEALADLDAAELAIAKQRGEVFFDRSLGASLDLMRALALAQRGDTAAALPLAAKAAENRPYALALQMAATMIRESARQSDPGVKANWPILTRLQPELAATAISLETMRGNYAEVVEIAKATPLHSPVLAKPQEGGQPFAAFTQHGRALLNTARAGHDLAYALAATGDAAGARAALDRAGETYRQLSGATVLPAAAAAADAKPRGNFFAPQARLAEARIALAENRIADAESLAKEGLPSGPPARDLRAAILAAKGEKAALVPPAVEPAKRKPSLGALASTLLIAHESPRSVIDYEKSRPDVLRALLGAAFSMGTTLLSGVEKTAGFKETANPDGTITVEYLGSTASAPMVQEMVLLRAAELAQAAGKPGFAITARNDYTRYLTQTQYHVAISRTPTGHKCEITIRLLDTPEAVAAQGFEALTVIDRLGPLYYEDKAKAASRGRAVAQKTS